MANVAQYMSIKPFKAISRPVVEREYKRVPRVSLLYYYRFIRTYKKSIEPINDLLISP